MICNKYVGVVMAAENITAAIMVDLFWLEGPR